MPQQGYRKKRARRKRRSAAYALLSIVLITAAVGLALSFFFNINRIEVNGSAIYTDSAVIAASGIKEGDNLFFINRGAALRNIFEDFPYVHEVRLVRRLPGTLVINVTERESLGLVAHETGHWLIDGTGRLLEQVSGRSVTGKPVVTGLTLLSPAAGTDAAAPREQEERLRALLLILDGLKQQELLSRVSLVDVSKTHELHLSYEEERFDVLLGDTADLDVKLSFLLAAIGELPASARGTLDVSGAAAQRKASYIPQASRPPSPEPLVLDQSEPDSPQPNSPEPE